MKKQLFVLLLSITFLGNISARWGHSFTRVINKVKSILPKEKCTESSDPDSCYRKHCRHKIINGKGQCCC